MLNELRRFALFGLSVPTLRVYCTREALVIRHRVFFAVAQMTQSTKAVVSPARLFEGLLW